MGQSGLNEMRLAFRVDASADIGMGHVMRCLALGQEWAGYGGAVLFWSRHMPEALQKIILSHGFEFVIIPPEVSFEAEGEWMKSAADASTVSWVVVDGYPFDEGYLSRMRSPHWKLMLVDDYRRTGEYPVDGVLNPNLHATSDDYRDVDTQVQKLVGADYFLLRSEFRSLEARLQRQGEPHNGGIQVGVTLGGGEAAEYVFRVIRAVSRLKEQDLSLTVIVGGGFNEPHRIEQALAEAGVSGLVHVSPGNYAQLICACDLLVTSAGVSSLEAAALGKSMLAVELADNQKPVAIALEQAGAARIIDQLASDQALQEAIQELAANQALRNEMGERAGKLVDGKGTKRVIASMLQAMFSIRGAEMEDARTFWEISNDPAVREASFQSADIPWESHLKWFKEQLLRPDRKFYFIEMPAEGVVGQLRFNLEDSFADISIALHARWRGLGLGDAVIRLACEHFLKENQGMSVRAFIKSNNQASIASFTRANFKFSHECKINNESAKVLVLESNKDENRQ